MASSLNVIALISGGKDSLFSILHCKANGHTIVALANLHPAKSANNNEDIDSYMYQTVGHSIIPLYEQALGLPLYREEISGKAVNSARDYERSEKQEQDETEDLVPLLQRIMKAHPDANAVSTGAILSTYQRTRVESVALRLGLTPLSYLWQYPLLPPYTQSSLLHDMAAVGQNAVIIKTASGGLDESFLGLNVADRRTVAKLSKAMTRFGEAGNGAIVGEGGEFETLTVDGPGSLWKRKIRLGEYEAGVVDGGQTIMKIKGSGVEEKMEDGGDGEGILRIPEIWDDEFSKVLRDAEKGATEDVDPTDKTTVIESRQDPTAESMIQALPTNTFTNTPAVFSYSNLTSPSPSSPKSTPSHQLTHILLRLDHILKHHQLLRSNINHCTLLLRSMSDFTVLNPIYAQYFGFVNPPARVTVAAGTALPSDVDVMLSIVLDKRGVSDTISRQGLHVQGRSYWAPANIGPYSQAISVPLPIHNRTVDQERDESNEIVYIAGQIPLVPASMYVFSPHSFRSQALLSLQHLWRIGRAKGVRWWTAGVGFIPASVADAEGAGKVAREAWEKVHMLQQQKDAGDGNEDEDDDEDVDPWDRINNTSSGSVFNDSTYRAPIPDLSAVKSTSDRALVPPCFIAQIESLPRNVDVEWSATGLTASSIRFEKNVDGTTISAPSQSRAKFPAFEIREKKDRGRIAGNKWASGTLYIGRGFEWDGKGKMEGVQWIPCHRVWGADGAEVQAVFVGRVDEESDENNKD